MKISRFLAIVLITAVLLIAVSQAGMAAGFFVQVSGEPSEGIPPEILSAAAGMLLSLAFSYVKGLNTWYAGLAEENKKLIMLGLLVLVSAGMYGLSCSGLLLSMFGLALTCNQEGIVQLVYSIILTITANQAVYKLSPQRDSVKEAKAARDEPSA